MSDAPIGVAVIGFGFMGRTHAAGFERARLGGVACELRAICAAAPVGGDLTDALGRPLPFDPAEIPLVTYVDGVLERNDIHAVSICTYTDTHVELARRALEAGKHVLVEKPVALSSQALLALMNEARDTAMLCTPALCMRYWPGWPWLRDRVRDGTYGVVREATFERISPMPAWSDFYADMERSGGALFDLHIHDADFVQWCFGAPTSVRSTGDLRSVRTSYEITSGVRLQATGTWSDEPGTPFQMRYRVVFEDAIVTFDASRDAPVILHRADHREAVTLPAETAYDAQARDFIEAILEPRPARATLEDAYRVTRLLEAELESAHTGEDVPVRY